MRHIRIDIIEFNYNEIDSEIENYKVYFTIVSDNNTLEGSVVIEDETLDFDVIYNTVEAYVSSMFEDRRALSDNKSELH